MEKASEVVEPVTLESSRHALDNAVVLRQIFKELARSDGIEDLKNARLVTNSSNWQNELLSVWRREAVLVLEDHQGLGDEDEPPQPGKRLSNFLGELEDLDLESPYRLVEVPYQRMKLRYMTVRQEDLDSSLGNFWDAVGSSVKHVTLQNVTLDMPRTQDLLLFLKAKLPNLESLRLDAVEQPSLLQLLENRRRTPGHRITLDKVTKLELGSGRSVKLKLGNFPNLQEVKLFGERGLQDMTNGPMTIIPGVKKVDLLDHAIENRVSVFSSRLHFSELEHLTAKTSDQRVINCLKAHSGTLRTLELFRSLVSYARANPIQTDFSVLTTLRLWGNAMKDLSFLRFTRNLQVLHWDVYGSEKESEMRDEMNQTTDRSPLSEDNLISNQTQRLMRGVELSKLGYCHLSCKLSAINVVTLSRWMPHLKTFNAVLKSSELRVACAQWEMLENLSCLFGSDIRDGIIAPEKDNSPKMMTVSETDIFTGVILRTFRIKHTFLTVDGLTDLNYLKSFSYYPECNGSTLSDACVNQGFLQMRQLEKLHIFVSDKFSEASEQLLAERIPDLKIYRHNSSEKLDCCKQMKYNKFIIQVDSEEEEEESGETDSETEESG